MAKKKSLIPGFSLKRMLGITKVKTGHSPQDRHTDHEARAQEQITQEDITILNGGITMKRLLIVLFVLILTVTGVAYANSATDYVQEEYGDVMSASAYDGTTAMCDFKILNTRMAEIRWTDGTNIMAAKGHPERLAYVYYNMLPLESWDVCRYVIGNSIHVSYGVSSNDICESVDDYAQEFETAFTQRTAVYPTAHFEQKTEEIEVEEAPEDTDTEYTQRYVLNTETNVFHDPDCRDVNKMDESNRRNFTGTREEVINMGYRPCGHCNP